MDVATTVIRRLLAHVNDYDAILLASCAQKNGFQVAADSGARGAAPDPDAHSRDATEMWVRSRCRGPTTTWPSHSTSRSSCATPGAHAPWRRWSLENCAAAPLTLDRPKHRAVVHASPGPPPKEFRCWSSSCCTGRSGASTHCSKRSGTCTRSREQRGDCTWGTASQVGCSNRVPTLEPCGGWIRAARRTAT